MPGVRVTSGGTVGERRRAAVGPRHGGETRVVRSIPLSQYGHSGARTPHAAIARATRRYATSSA